MSKYTELTIKMLYARSGNICSYPSCNKHLISENINISQIAHIISVKPGGPRHIPELDPKFYDSEENLILLCGQHHKEIDTKENEYPIDMLRNMKAIHEQQIAQSLLNAKEREIILVEEFYKIICKYQVKWILDKSNFLKPVLYNNYCNLDLSVIELKGLMYTMYFQFSNEILKDMIKLFCYKLDQFTSVMGIYTDFDGDQYCIPNEERIRANNDNVNERVSEILVLLNKIITIE